MQEQRVTAMLRRIDEVRQAAAGRLDVEREIETLKRLLAGAHQELQRLRMEEADLAATVVTEQQRWAEFSRQLDELDRLLRR